MCLCWNGFNLVSEWNEPGHLNVPKALQTFFFFLQICCANDLMTPSLIIHKNTFTCRHLLLMYCTYCIHLCNSISCWRVQLNKSMKESEWIFLWKLLTKIYFLFSGRKKVLGIQNKGQSVKKGFYFIFLQNFLLSWAMKEPPVSNKVFFWNSSACPKGSNTVHKYLQMWGLKALKEDVKLHSHRETICRCWFTLV